MIYAILRALFFTLLALTAARAECAPATEIGQRGPHQALTVRAVGRAGRWIGFDLLSDGKKIAPVRFTSFGLITSRFAAVTRDGDSSALAFEDLQAEPNCGLNLERSRVEIRLTAGRYPVVRFAIHIKSFNAAVWLKTLGRVPLHFLTLTEPGADQWHQGGALFPVNPKSKIQNPKWEDWSAPVALSDSPLPVVGLWDGKAGLYAAWDFLPTRLRDNSERDIQTAFCRSLTPPPAPSDLPQPPAPGHRTQAGKLRFPPPGTPLNTPTAPHPYLTDHHEGRFVALVLPMETQGGAGLDSEMRLVYAAGISRADAPNRFLFHYWAEDEAVCSLLPTVPAPMQVPKIPAALAPRNLAETQPLAGDAVTGLLQTYLADMNSLPRHAFALDALEQARNLVYRDLIFTIGDSDRRDDVDPAFRWQNFSAAKLDALAAVAAHTGDPVLLWALRGTLAHLPENLAQKTTERLRRVAPVAGTDARLIAGDKTALALSGGANITLSDYRRDADGNFALTLRTEKARLAVTLCVPGADLRGKAVYLLRGRLIRRALQDASQIVRDAAAPDTLLIFGLRDRDRLQIGELDARAEELPTAPPLVPAEISGGMASAEATGAYQPVALQANSRRNRSRAENGEANESVLRWYGGIPFRVPREALPQKGDDPTSLPAEISEAQAIYVLYAPDPKEDAALPLLTLDDGGIAPPTDAAPRTLAASEATPLRIAAYHLPLNRRVVAIDAGALRIFSVTFLHSPKK